MFREALAISKKVLGEDNCLTLLLGTNLVLSLYLQGENKEAELLSQKILTLGNEAQS